MGRCETEIDGLKLEVEQGIWTFRWIWLINVAAIIYGTVVHNWDVVVVTAVSAAVAMVGIGRTRWDRKLVDRVAKVCIPKKSDEDSGL